MGQINLSHPIVPYTLTNYYTNDYHAWDKHLGQIDLSHVYFFLYKLGVIPFIFLKNLVR